MLDIERDTPWTPPWVRARRAHTSADDLLSAYEVSGPPVPVELLVKNMGVRLHRVIRPGWDGALKIENGEAHIWVDGGVAATRQRFTIAHELGHLVLHDGDTMFRERITLVGVSPQEREANQFAAELLMPKAMVRSYLGGRTLAEMAELFEVSEAAMGIRLHTLRLGKQFG